MNIKLLEKGKEYTLAHAYGQPDQKVMVLNVEERSYPNCGKIWYADVIYTSDDATKGLQTSMNSIECERYLYPIR
jgi:hypothetical protein